MMQRYVIHKISQIMKEEALTNVKIVGIYGFTYKENIDNTRESPTLQMLQPMDDALSGDLVQVSNPYVKKTSCPTNTKILKAFWRQ